MFKRINWLLGVLCLPLVAAFVARAQQPEPLVYTYVALWGVPRAQWDEFTAFGERSIRPVLERRLADGTITSWGNFATVVHEVDGFTHGIWWQASSIATIERVREELIKLPPSPAITGARHRDHLFRSLIHRSHAASGSGYLRVIARRVESGKGQEWRELWEKYDKPTYDELLANGTISFYEVQLEHIRTEDPRLRYTVYITPTADALDKVVAAFLALEQKHSPEERRAVDAAFREVIAAGTRRDYFARIVSYAQK